jgi:hypothetical protein
MIIVYYEEYPCEHFKKEIAKAERDLKDHKLVPGIVRMTGSEHYILRLLQAVRNGDLRTDELQLFCNDVQVDVDVKGEFIQPWPDELFEAAFYLRFDKSRPIERAADARADVGVSPDRPST